MIPCNWCCHVLPSIDVSTRVSGRVAATVFLSFFAPVVGFIREHTASSTDLCPVRYRFPRHKFRKLALLRKLVCDARKSAGECSSACRRRCRGRRQGVQVIPHVSQKAKGWRHGWGSMVHGRHTKAMQGLTRHSPSSGQVMAVVRFAMLYMHRCGNQVFKFFEACGTRSRLR